MGCHVTIIAGNGKQYEFQLRKADLSGLDAREAHDWLTQEFEKAGCVPTNPVGKLLLADKILCLAQTRSDADFAGPSPWANDFLRAAAVAADRDRLTIDLGNYSLRQ